MSEFLKFGEMCRRKRSGKLTYIFWVFVSIFLFFVYPSFGVGSLIACYLDYLRNEEKPPRDFY